MKNFTALICVFFLSACASSGPSYEGAQNSGFTKANYEAVDRLVTMAAVPIDRSTPMLVATLVNIDSLTQSSRFGRLISEQIASRITQLGYSVAEMKLRSDVYIKEGTGELLLSRDVRNLSKTHNAQVVVVGNYAVAANYVYLTLKFVTVADNRVIAAVNYLLPMTQNNDVMLKQP